MCDACQEDLQKSISVLQTNIDWVKNTTYIRLFGKWKIPQGATKGIKLYELKSLVHRQGWNTINSKMEIREKGRRGIGNLESQKLLHDSGN